MSTEKKYVNDLKDIALKHFSSLELLGELADGLIDKRNAAPDQKLSPADERRWRELIDLMHYLEQGHKNSNDDFPVTDPHTLIRRQVKEQLIDKEDGAALQDEFNKAVCEAVGHDLTEKQVKKLFKVFRTFDPVASSLKR